MTSILYLVPTPLGDPDDITLRALRILREVSAIAILNDDPVGKNLLTTYEISTEIILYSNVISTLNSGDVALVAIAGTPGIGDAAQEIVREALARGIRVEPLPGASAEITALVLSGLPTEAFVYVGALPDDLSRYAHERDTMIFATNDVTEPAMRLLAALGDRQVCITRFAPTEWIYRGTLSDAANDDRTQPGADGIYIVVAGAPPQIAEVWDETRVRVVLREHLRQGEPLKLAAKAVAALAGWDRRTVYALGVDEKQNPP
jgi:16S rRNA (cytidine1402-2'-O)-methyltransferase